MAFDIIDKVFPTTKIFDQFDAYDLDIDCTHKEWEQFVAKLDESRLHILPLNVENEPDFHNSIAENINLYPRIRYVGTTEPIHQMEI